MTDHLVDSEIERENQREETDGNERQNVTTAWIVGSAICVTRVRDSRTETPRSVSAPKASMA
jgi:hypothetical protein